MFRNFVLLTLACTAAEVFLYFSQLRQGDARIIPDEVITAFFQIICSLLFTTQTIINAIWSGIWTASLKINPEEKCYKEL